MPPTQYAFFVAVAVAILVLLSRLLITRQLKEKYVVMWWAVGLATVVVSAFPQLLAGAAGLVGVKVPANLLFFLAIVMLMGVTVHLSWECSRLEARIRVLAEDNALTRHRLDQLEAAAPRPEAATLQSLEDSL